MLFSTISARGAIGWCVMVRSSPYVKPREKLPAELRIFSTQPRVLESRIRWHGVVEFALRKIAIDFEDKKMSSSPEDPSGFRNDDANKLSPKKNNKSRQS